MLTSGAHRMLAALVAAGLVAGVAGTAAADGGKDAKAGTATKAKIESTDNAKRATDAAHVLTAAAAAKDGAIPKGLLDKAKAIAVFPDVVKGAVLAGGQYGKGLVAQRNALGEWSAPAYVTIGGASFGFQAGIESVDLVLVFTSQEALDALLKDELELGASVEVAAGPVGRSAEVSANSTFDSPIYSYSRSKGLFAGASLVGAVVKADSDANAAVYGDQANTIAKILNGNVEAAADVAAFAGALPERSASAGS